MSDNSVALLTHTQDLPSYYVFQISARESAGGRVTFVAGLLIPDDALDSHGWAVAVVELSGDRIVRGDASFQVEEFRYWGSGPGGTAGGKQKRVEIVAQAYEQRMHNSEEESRNPVRYGGTLAVGAFIFVPKG